jgi:hypothetical protein
MYFQSSLLESSAINHQPSATAMAPMTVEELQKHPEYKHTIWHLKPEQQGKVTVAKDRGGPLNIAYEVHGHGNRHLVVSCLTFGSNITPNIMCCTSGNKEELGVGLGCICHTAFSDQFLGSRLLSPFRFSRIHRLNSSTLRLILPMTHAHLTISSYNPFSNPAISVFTKTCSRHARNTCTSVSSGLPQRLTQCSGLWALVA